MYIYLYLCVYVSIYEVVLRVRAVKSVGGEADESWHTCKCVMANVQMSHGTHTHASGHTYQCCYQQTICARDVVPSS